MATAKEEKLVYETSDAHVVLPAAWHIVVAECVAVQLPKWAHQGMRSALHSYFWRRDGAVITNIDDPRGFHLWDAVSCNGYATYGKFANDGNTGSDHGLRWSLAALDVIKATLLSCCVGRPPLQRR